MGTTMNNLVELLIKNFKVEEEKKKLGIEKKEFDNKDEIIFFFNKIKRDIRSERFLMMFLLQVLSSKVELKNVFIY